MARKSDFSMKWRPTLRARCMECDAVIAELAFESVDGKYFCRGCSAPNRIKVQIHKDKSATVKVWSLL
jgi:hypothetical protein